MIKLMSIVSIFLLFFTGITAMIGGGMLIADPSGRPLRMDSAMLAGSPFDTFLLPGLILFLFIGASSIVVAFLVIGDKSYSTRLVLNQGIILIAWIVVQILMIHQFHILQMLYFAIGVAFVYTGYLGIDKKEYLHV